MKVQYKINGSIVGKAKNKDSAIRAARKAALALNNTSGIIHVEVITQEDPEEDPEVLHRDMVLAENKDLLKTNELTSIGLVTFTKASDLPKVEKSNETKILYKVGDYIISDSELYRIISVTDSTARAEPVRKKSVTIVDKFTNKKRTFAVKRRAIGLSPIAQGVLSDEEIKKEMKKIEDLENGKNIRDSGKDSGDSGEQQGTAAPDGGDSAVSVSANSGQVQRKRGRPKGSKNKKKA